MKYSKKNKITITIFIAGILASCMLFIPSQENIVYAQTPEPPLIGRCFPDSPNVNVGETVAWVADASGGIGRYYRYSWSGSDKLSGSSWTARKAYDTPGLKTASVRIRTRNQSIVRTCSVNVGVGGEVLGDYIDTYSPLSLSCFATPTSAEVGESVSWTVIASGETGDFRYDWTGSEELSGSTNSITKTYETTGRKSASVKVTSNDRSSVTNCSLEIFPEGTLTNSPGSSTTTKGDTPSDNLPETSIVSNIWKALFFIITAIGLSILLVFVFILRNKSKELKKRTSLAYETKSRETDVVSIIEREARHKKVIVAADALKILVENSEDDPAEAVKNLHQLISEMRKRPLTTIPGEDRWPVITKDEVEKYFLRRKAE